MLTASETEALVGAIDDARRSRRAIPMPSASHPGVTLEDAYVVQHGLIDRRLAEGRRIAGYKVAFTTGATQRRLGIPEPAYGILSDDAVIRDGTAPSSLIAPSIEAEIAFVMRRGIEPNSDPATVMRAVEYITAAIEVIDSRLLAADPATGTPRRGVDIIADSCGAACIMLSEQKHDPGTYDLSRASAVVRHNDAIEDSGVFAMVFGTPWNALPWLATKLAAHGRRLEAGDIVMSGSAIRPYPAKPGDRFEIDYGPLGMLSLAFS